MAVTNTADFEKLGVFYLGRPWDPALRKPKPGLVLYESKDLVTHAVCVGMTGSGKTGLCLALLEEAALDGIPALVIDPKGDLADLMLTFPDLRPEDFLPWINEDDARRKGLEPAAYARQQAELWKTGHAGRGQDGARIRRLRDAVDIAIYTPGSEAGIPVSILASFAAPPPAIREDGELFRERVAGTATSLLGMLGIDADPIKSREHILISTILDAAWRDGRDLDLAALVQAIQTPPVARVGVLDLESFYPAKARFELATALNNLRAAPGFAAWIEGEPLDVGRMLRTAEGKPRVAICSIAHLGDAERMFFVSLLLNQALAWTRAQTGTTSLRAIVYMDEIFGYFPPVANPPSKLPLLTLLKQARAFGVGVVLATQNPVDLDYKGLANTGTWFIGRLQTERDKARVLEGLEGAAAGSRAGFDRQRMEHVLAGLGSRIFLLHNVHEDRPEVFESRWAMSYLRGPLTREEIRRLMAPRKAAAAGPAGTAAPAPSPAAARPAPAVAPAAAARPVLPPGVPQYFLPASGTAPATDAPVYRPMLFGAASVRFADAKAGVDLTEEAAFLTGITAEAVPVSWDDAAATDVAAGDLAAAPREPAGYAELPPSAARPKSYPGWSRDFASWLARSQKLELFRDPGSRQISRPGESERDFRIRLGEAAREERDARAEALRKKYRPRIAALEERQRRAEQAVAREQEQATRSGIEAGISVVGSILGAVLGRKGISAADVGRATTAARSAGRVLKEREDVGRARETKEAVEQDQAALEAELQAELAELEAKADPLVARP